MVKLTLSTAMIAPIFVLCYAVSSAAAYAELRVTPGIPGTPGNFTITLDGKTWLSGSEYRVGGLSSAEGTLVLLSQVHLQATK